MMTFKVQILVGLAEGDEKEGIIPQQSLWLIENAGDMPIWVLKEQGITWMVKEEDMLESGLLMAGIFMRKDPELVALANKYLPRFDHTQLDIDISEENLEILFAKNRELCWGKLIITVLDRSETLYQLIVLEDYAVDVEVCIPAFRRFYSDLDGEFNVIGDLNFGMRSPYL
jgi:hypothetical protein